VARQENENKNNATTIHRKKQQASSSKEFSLQTIRVVLGNSDGASQEVKAGKTKTELQ